MTAPADLYQEVDPFESFDGLEYADEAKQAFVPGRRIFSPGGLATATLVTPKGPAKLNLPSPVPTLQQFRSLEQTVNSVTQRLNATNTALLQVRRELATRKAADFGSGSTGLILSMFMQRKVRDDLEGHTHTGNNVPPTLPSDSSKFDALLPILLLQPGIFGGQSASGAPGTGGSQESMMPLLLMMMLLD